MRSLIFPLVLTARLWGAIAPGVADNGNAFSNPVATGGVNHTAGSGIMCMASWDTFQGTVAFTNTAGDTWIQIDAFIDGGSLRSFVTAYVKSSAGNASDVVTATTTGAGSANFWSITCQSFTGQNTSSTLDAHATGVANTATTITSAAFTTATADEIIIAAFCSGTFSLTWTAGNIGGSAATIPSGATTAFAFCSLEYLVVSSTQSSITAAASISSSSSALGIGVATFKQAAAAGGSNTPARGFVF